MINRCKNSVFCKNYCLVLMQIVHFITRSDTIGGAQKYILETSRKFLEDGNNVTVVAGGEGPFKLAVEGLGVVYHSIPHLIREISLFADIKNIGAIHKVINDLHPDVVFIHSAKAGLLGRLALAFSDCKVIFVAHGWSNIRVASPKARFFYSLLEWGLSKLCHRIVCISKEDVFFAINKLRINKNKISLIYNGVREPHDVFREEPLQQEVKLLTVTRFQEPKDFDTLIESLFNIVQLKWSLTVLGDGPLLGYYKDKAISLGLIDRIEFLGFKSVLDDYYFSHDVVLLISNSEGLPLSLIEAMSYKKPILASAVGGVPELIVNEVNGYLIPPKDVAYLTTCLENICSMSDEQLIKLGKNSYRIYKNKFSFESMVDKLYDLC